MRLVATILDSTALESSFQYSTAQVQNCALLLVYEVWSNDGLARLRIILEK